MYAPIDLTSPNRAAANLTDTAIAFDDQHVTSREGTPLPIKIGDPDAFDFRQIKVALLDGCHSEVRRIDGELLPLPVLRQTAAYVSQVANRLPSPGTRQQRQRG